MSYAQPLPNINRIIFLGASIQNDALLNYSGRIVLGNYLEQQTGRPFTVIDAAVSGEDLTQIATRWDTIKSTYVNDANTLVLVHALGDTISDSGAWGGLTTQEQTDIATEYNNLIQNIQTNGNLPAPTHTSFRSYEEASLNSESDTSVLGSFLYNQNVLTPALANITVPMGDSSFTYFDWYDVTRNLYTAFRDSIHPNNSLSSVLIAYTAQQIINRINGASPLVIARVSDPSLSQNAVPVPSIFTAGTGILNTFETDTGNIGGHIPHIFNDDMYTKISSLTITALAAMINKKSNNGGSLNTGDITQTSTNDLIKSWFLYTESPARIFTVSGYQANQKLQIQITAYRSLNTNDRVGRYSVNKDLSDDILIDASTNATSATAGATMNTGTLTAQADASGNVTVYYAPDGSGYAYVNSVQITPVLDVIVNVAITGGMPDGTYRTLLVNQVTNATVLDADVTYVGGLSTIVLDTGANVNDIITGYVVSNEVDPLKVAPIKATAVN